MRRRARKVLVSEDLVGKYLVGFVGKDTVGEDTVGEDLVGEYLVGEDLVGEPIEESVSGDLVNVGGYIVLRVRVAGVVRRKGFLRKLLEGWLLAHQFNIRQDWQPDLF